MDWQTPVDLGDRHDVVGRLVDHHGWIGIDVPVPVLAADSVPRRTGRDRRMKRNSLRRSYSVRGRVFFSLGLMSVYIYVRHDSC